MAIKSPKKDYTDKSEDSKDKVIQTGNEPKNKVPFMVVEAYKSLRVQLIATLEKTGGKVIALSSANASEGKSTTSANLAITLSQLNKKVILIDTDGRRGTIHQKLKLENKLGCIDVLEGKLTWQEAIKKYNPYLDVITIGKITNNPTELFCSSAFERLITEVKNEYDYVVFDTAPINLVSDALVIAQKCDGLVMIVRTNVTTFEEFKTAYTSIGQLNIELIGVVMNGIGDVSGYYAGYGRYGKYYKSYRKGYYSTRNR